MIGKARGTDQESVDMKPFDIVATMVLILLFFVALVLHVLAPKPLLPPALHRTAAAAESPARALSLCKTLLQATINGDFNAFKNECFKEGDAQMKLFAAQPATGEMFRRAAETIGPACKSGCDMEYLASINQQGNEVYLWKLVPRSGKNQFLVRLTLNGGKVSGFFFQ